MQGEQYDYINELEVRVMQAEMENQKLREENSNLRSRLKLAIVSLTSVRDSVGSMQHNLAQVWRDWKDEQQQDPD